MVERMISVAFAMVLAFFGCGHREGLEGVCYKDHESKMTKWKNSHCLMRVMCYTLCPSPPSPRRPKLLGHITDRCSEIQCEERAGAYDRVVRVPRQSETNEHNEAKLEQNLSLRPTE